MEVRKNFLNIQKLLFKNSLMWSIVVPLIIAFCNIVVTVGETYWGPGKDSDVTVYGTGVFLATWIVICLMGFTFSASNILTDKYVGMYPGTIMTRFYARLAFDIERIFYWSVLGLLSQCGVYWIATLMADNNDISSVILIDASSLPLKYLLLFLLATAIYLFIVLLTVLLSKIRGIIVGGILLVLELATILIDVGLEAGICESVFKFITGEGINATKYMMVLLITIAVLLVAICLVVRLVKCWRMTGIDTRVWAIVGISAFLLLMSTSMGYVTYTNTGHISKDETVLDMIESGKVLYKDVVIEDDRGIAKANSYGAYYSYITCDEAIECGVITKEDRPEKGKTLVRIVCDDIKYGDREVTKEFIDGLNIESKGPEKSYILTVSEKKIVYDDAFKILYKIANPDKYNEREKVLSMVEDFENVSIFVIAD